MFRRISTLAPRVKGPLVLAASGVLALALVACSDDKSPTDSGVITDAGVTDAGEVDAGVDAGPPDSGEYPIITPNETGWWRGATGYQIFVRSFYDSNGDGIGDLPGVTQKLDYLNDGQPGGNDLGVDFLWLMPLNASPSYHGYDVTDYKAVNPQYGTLADFDALTQAANARGMRVILDLSLNHSSSEHPWFLSSMMGPTSDKRDYYIWRTEAPMWRRPWDGARVWHEINGAYLYALFGPALPDLNLANPVVEAEMRDVMKFWLSHGADGFRVDAARYLIESADGVLADIPETHQFMRKMRHEIHQEYPNAMFVAEAWTGTGAVAPYYGAGNEYQLAFSFDLAGAIKAAVGSGSKTELQTAMNATANRYTDRGFEAPFLSNHDMLRVMQQFAGDDAQMRLAAATLFAQPGTPFVYYGEEIGMQGGLTPAEQDKRTTMHWDGVAPGYGFTSTTAWYPPARERTGVDVASQIDDPTSLLAFYRELIQLRKSSPVLQHGDASVLSGVNGGRGTFAFSRTYQNKRVVFVANFDTAESTSFSLPLPGSSPLTGTPRVMKASGLKGTPTATATSIDLEGLMPRSFAFIALDD